MVLDDTESYELYLEWLAARHAEIPDLVEIRRLRRAVEEAMDRAIDDYLSALSEDEEGEIHPLTRRPPVRLLISNDELTSGPRSSLCSPVKTEAMRRFEREVRAVFGETGPGVTLWPS